MLFNSVSRAMVSVKRVNEVLECEPVIVSGDKKGDKYVGDWVEGERTGFGIYYYADGTSKSGQWEKGKFIG